MVEKTGRPGYLQIADDLRSQIQSGKLAPGAALPSTAELGARYDVSASVVKSAISVLRTEKLIIGQQGKGVFVREQLPAAPSEASSDGESELLRQLVMMREAVQDLGQRVADLEKIVLSERKGSD
ncbi:GntR family transcriptional regulator [Herbidospora cretacea]|uniref:GntR family transcriptional regulator n=1 Tax=Herbidospora cretacea TaxID=28444 RepID=UPI0007732854|nr:winged helix-turn-helix domain-containing protein [Herbidospora cretacea]